MILIKVLLHSFPSFQWASVHNSSTVTLTDPNGTDPLLVSLETSVFTLRFHAVKTKVYGENWYVWCKSVHIKHLIWRNLLSFGLFWFYGLLLSSDNHKDDYKQANRRLFANPLVSVMINVTMQCCDNSLLCSPSVAFSIFIIFKNTKRWKILFDGCFNHTVDY